LDKNLCYGVEEEQEDGDQYCQQLFSVIIKTASKIGNDKINM
jgi:hypothetical protein